LKRGARNGRKFAEEEAMAEGDRRTDGWSGGRFGIRHCGEVLHDHAMHEDVPAPDLAQKEHIRRIIQKPHIPQRRKSFTPEQKAQDVVLDDGVAAKEQVG